MTVVIQTGVVSGILEHIVSMPLHFFTDLTLSFNNRRIAISIVSHLLRTSTSSANLPRLRHLHIDLFSTTVELAVALVASQAPHLTTLQISDVLFISGCSAVLARIGRLPLRAQHGWVVPDDVVDSVARLQLNVWEFALQLHSGPLIFHQP
jgi:hypothetical protein